MPSLGEPSSPKASPTEPSPKTVQVGGRGAKGDRFKILSEWAEARDVQALFIMLEANNVARMRRVAEHLYISLLMRTDAWRRIVQRFDPASAHTSLNMMGNILEPRKGEMYDAKTNVSAVRH